MHRELRERLAALDDGERRRLYAEAAKLRRRAAQDSKGGSRERRRRREDDEEGGRRRSRRTRRTTSGSLDDWVLRLLREEDERTPGADPERGITGTVQAATVTWVTGGRCRVRTASGEVDAVIAHDVARRQASLLAVGDDVLVRAGTPAPIVMRVLPRRTSLTRPDPHVPQRRRVVVANVDVVAIVASARTPPFRPRLVDRYLVAVARGGASPILCVNKVDLVTGSAREALEGRLLPFREAEVPVICCSAATGEGLDRLATLLADRTGAFVGHSGVGKSSLLNALLGTSAERTGEVDARTGQGRHSTTWSSLHELPAGGRVIDTPGVRSFSLGPSSAAELLAAFPELAAHASRCAFSDCAHAVEPRCGVREAVERGEVSAARYASYRRLLDGGG